MPRSRFWVVLACFLSSSFLNAVERDIWVEHQVGLLGSERGDPVFAAIKAGFTQAMEEAELEYHSAITVIDKTPQGGAGADQSQLLRSLYPENVSGVLLQSRGAGVLSPGVKFLKKYQIPVVALGRVEQLDEQALALFVRDEEAFGRLAVEACVKGLGRRGGRVALLAGLADSVEQRQRLNGALGVLEQQERVDLHQVLHCAETLESALAVVEQAMTEDRYDEIDAWVFLGDWPLRGAAPLDWGKRRIVCTAVGELPSMLAYLKRKELIALVSQDYHEWGYRAGWILAKQFHAGEGPSESLHVMAPRLVDRTNFDAVWRDWSLWLQ